MTYTEFKTALRAGQIQTATVGVDQISGKLADGKVYHTVRVDDPDLLKDLEANKVNATGQVASNGGILALLGWLLPLVLFGAFGYFMLKSMRGAAAARAVPAASSPSARARRASSRASRPASPSRTWAGPARQWTSCGRSPSTSRTRPASSAWAAG